MERKLAHIEKIVGLSPIEGADRIEVATVLGWQCVVKKGEFNIDDKVVYIEVDSVVPEKPEYEFLRERKFRVRTIKLRKQISQGLVLPLSVLPSSVSVSPFKQYKEGQDVTEILGIKKYDPQTEKELAEQDARLKNPIVKFMSRYKWFRKIFLQKQSGKFPNWIQKTDEERVQNIPRIVRDEFRNLFSITEKLDGQSATYFIKKNNKKSLFGKEYEFGVCSRNLRRGKPDNSSYWVVARENHIENKLLDMAKEYDFEFIVLQGEILGKGIQENKYKIYGYDFRAYNVVVPERRLESKDAKDWLDEYDIKFVPILGEIQLPNTVDELVKLSIGQSVLKPDIMREGLVLRKVGYPELSFKVINPEFLLKNGE